MSFYDIQKQVDEGTSQFDPQYWPPLEQFEQLVEEVGEVGRELNYIYGTKKRKSNESVKKLSSELADVLFTIGCIANSNNIRLQHAWDSMMREKRYKRDNERFEKK